MSARGRKNCAGETSRRSLRKFFKPQYPVPQENFPGKNTKGRIRNSPFSKKSRITVSKEQGESLRYEYDGKVWNIGPAYVSRFQVAGFLRGLTKFVQEYNANLNQNQKKESIAQETLFLEQLSGVSNNVSSLCSSLSPHDSIDKALSPSRVAVESAWKATVIDDDKSSNQDVNLREMLYSKNMSTKDHEKCTDAYCNQTFSGISETQAGCSNSLENGFEMLNLNWDAGYFHRSKSVSSGENAKNSSPLQLSLRLEKLNLTDMDVEMVMSWCIDMFNEGYVVIRKLWFFGNRIGDAGALAIARFISQSSGMKCGEKDHNINFLGLSEIHLSHNRISDCGAHCILTSISEVKNFETGTPIWLRLEWNRISVANLCDIIDYLYEDSGLIVDMPMAAHGCQNHCSSALILPKYYCSMTNIFKAPGLIKNQDGDCKLPNQNSESPQKLMFTSETFSNKKLKNVIDKCHVRMPWINSQYEKPCEAKVLQEATRLWMKTSHRTLDVEVKLPKDNSDSKVSKGQKEQDKYSEKKVDISDVVDKASGPLLFVLDTSAVLSMLEAPSSVALPINFTFKRLISLSEKKCFGQELPDEQRTFFVIPSCVALQLDALKNDNRAKSCIRRFFGKEIDEWGPSGHNVLTLLGTHEGEGLLVDHQAEIIDSFAYYNTSKGQQIDTRVVEVALFFQTECLRALYTNPMEGEIQNTTSSEIDKTKKINAIPYNLSAQKMVVNHLPVCLITGDNFQAQFARAHGVPSLRTADLQLHLGRVMDDVLSKTRFKPLTSSYLRSILRNTAIAGLRPVNARNLQKEFDGSVACLHASMTLVSSYQNRISKALEILTDDSVVDITDSEKIQRACDALSGDVFSGSCKYLHNSAQVLPSISDNDSIQKQMLDSPDEFITRVQARLEEWQTRSIKSQESVRRVLHWPKSPSQT